MLEVRHVAVPGPAMFPCALGLGGACFTHCLAHALAQREARAVFPSAGWPAGAVPGASDQVVIGGCSLQNAPHRVCVTTERMST